MTTNNNWFLCSIKVEKQLEGKDLPCKVTEKYLFEAANYTDAESRVLKELSTYYPAIEEIDIVKKRYTEVFFYGEKDDKFYEAKVSIITFDEKSGSEKKNMVKMLFNAYDFTFALDKLKMEMKGSMQDYEIISISETPIIDVYLI